MASKRGRKESLCASEGRIHDEPACFHDEVLDIVSEFILVAALPPNCSIGLEQDVHLQGSKEHSPESASLGDTKYINASLRKALGLPPGSLPPPGKLFDLTLKDNEYHGKAILENFEHKQIIFFASGQLKHAKGLCYFKLVDTKDEKYILKQLYSKSEFMMTVLEKGDESDYEWRHVLPNNCFLKFYPIPERLKEFRAKERYNLNERKKFFEAIDISKATGASIEVDNQNRSVNGFLLPPGVFLTYLYTDPNTNLDIVGTIIFDGDVLKAARERIAELKDFFENAPLMMGVIELRGDSIVILYGNSATSEAYPEGSISTESIISQSRRGDGKDDTHYLVIDNLVDSSILDQYRNLYKQSRESGKVVQADIHDPFRKTYNHVTISTISYDRESQISKHVYMVADKTQQRLTEIELERYKDSLKEKVQQRTLEVQEKELHLRTLVSNAPNIILSVDRTGKITHFVSSDGSVLVGQRLDSLVVDGPELILLLSLLFDEAFSSPPPSSSLSSFGLGSSVSLNGNGLSSSSGITMNGGNNNNKKSSSFKREVKLRDLDVWLTLSVGRMNENLAIVVATDITEIKQMSEELNLALTTKSRFLANMSHEVRTPLSGIIGMSRMLQETGLTMDQTECVATIQHCGETLLSVINSILDYTKLEAAGTAGVPMILEHSEISLQQCLEESLYTILPVARQKKLELILDIDPRVPDRILGDIIRLRQVMLNLLNNAVKFTDVGYILVSLTASEIEGSDDWKFHFTIHDTGCGVPPESQGKLFQMFSQVDVSSTRRYGGTGIGLALAKRFLEMMGGDITMQSLGVAGEGSTFLFCITATPAPAVVPDSPASSYPLSPFSFTSLSTFIYIIEPCQIASEVLKKRLQAKAFTTVTTINEEAYDNAFNDILHQVNQSSTDKGDHHMFLIFCNIEVLSSDKPYPLTGKSNLRTVFMGYLRPPNISFLRKPIKESTLRACLKDFLSKHPISSSSAALSSSSLSSSQGIPRPSLSSSQGITRSSLSSSQGILHPSLSSSSISSLPHPLLSSSSISSLQGTPHPPLSSSHGISRPSISSIPSTSSASSVSSIPSLSSSPTSIVPSTPFIPSTSTPIASPSSSPSSFSSSAASSPLISSPSMSSPISSPSLPSSHGKSGKKYVTYPLSILVVEDNEINQKVVKRVFAHLGYPPGVAMVSNGLEALHYIHDHHMPDTILMDIQMPVLDGIQTTKMIREKYPRANVYIAAMTANCFPEDRQNCLDAGMDDFLTKPLRIEQLQLVLLKSYNMKINHSNNNNNNNNNLGNNDPHRSTINML